MSLAAPPRGPIVDKSGSILRIYEQWLLSLTTVLDTTPAVKASKHLTGQTAAVSTAAIPLASITQGIYRISYHLRITTAAGVSSSATVTIGYTSDGIACQQSGAAVTGNTTGTVQGNTFVVRADSGTPITYAVAYASNPANAMAFKFDVTAELIEATS